MPRFQLGEGFMSTPRHPSDAPTPEALPEMSQAQVEDEFDGVEPLEAVPLEALSRPVLDDVDAPLVERVQRGDQRAFELLVVKYERRIQRLVARMVRDSGLVEDITQEAFIRAYRALPNFRGD